MAGYDGHFRVQYLWIGAGDGDIEDVPLAIRAWFAGPDANDALGWYQRISDVTRTRVDNLIGRMIGRHPDEVHHQNFEMCYLVWRERWNLMVLYAEEPMPGTPPREE